ncbi:hypothetical protein HK405_007017 [Cladochytrium tenue]|nr:hypothetical protein HK405_007017 [Cladochytrium tenue]
MPLTLPLAVKAARRCMWREAAAAAEVATTAAAAVAADEDACDGGRHDDDDIVDALDDESVSESEAAEQEADGAGDDGGDGGSDDRDDIDNEDDVGKPLQQNRAKESPPLAASARANIAADASSTPSSNRCKPSRSHRRVSEMPNSDTDASSDGGVAKRPATRFGHVPPPADIARPSGREAPSGGAEPTLTAADVAAKRDVE